MKKSEGIFCRLRLHVSRHAKSVSLPDPTLLSVVAVGLLLGWIWTQIEMAASKRDELTLAAAQRESANVATVVAQHTTRTLVELDQIAHLAQARYRELGNRFNADQFVREVGLDRKLVYALIIVDEHGSPVAASDGVRPVSFADREYFKLHREGKLDRAYIARPLFGSVVPRWVLPVTWRIDKSDGTFGGIISIGINPYYFVDLFRRIELGDRGVISLVGTDGVIRARLSEQRTTFGHDIGNAKVMAAVRQNERGAIDHPAVVDGVHRLYSYQKVEQFPLHVIVGRSRETVMALSMHERAAAYVQGAIATVAIVLVAIVLGYLRLRERRLNLALEVAQSKQRAILDSISDPVWLKDAHGSFVAVNPAFERVFGIDAAEIVGKTRNDLFRCEGESRSTDCPCSRGEPCTGGRCEVRLRSQGEERWLETASAPIVAGGTLSGVAGSARDITIRKELERQLQESHDRLQRALDHSAMAVWEWHVDSGRLIHTEGLSTLLGYTDGHEFVSREQWVEHILPEDRDQVQTAMRRCLQDHADYCEEYRVQGGDGRQRWVQVRGGFNGNADAGGETIVSGIVQDVSARKASEFALRESEQRFRVLVENMDDIFWIASPQLDALHYLSPGFQRTLGVEAATLYREPRRWQELVHPEDLNAGRAFVAEQLRGVPAMCEIRMRHTSGEYRWMHVRSVPWYDAHDTLLSAGMAEDITERKQASEQRLRDAVRQRDALVMEVHHRIKNNLQGVLGLLEEHKCADAQTRAFLRTLGTRIQSVATVHGLQGRRTGSVVLLAELVRAIAENVRGFGLGQIDVAMMGGPFDYQLKEREAVPVALILNELIWNAIKHSCDAESGVRVRIAVEREGQVSVAIFNRGEIPVTRVDSARLSGGLGLGLIRALMPPRGAALSLEAQGDDVCATLALAEPVVEPQPHVAAA